MTVNTCEQFTGACRRLRRSESRHEAIGHHLCSVREEYELDAIVVADDMGRPLVQVGDAKLSQLLADSVMWSTDGVDAWTLHEIRNCYPDLDEQSIVSRGVAVPGATGVRVVGAGRSRSRHQALDHAAAGVDRICGSANAPLEHPAASNETVRPNDMMKPKPRETGVRWRIFQR